MMLGLLPLTFGLLSLGGLSGEPLHLHGQRNMRKGSAGTASAAPASAAPASAAAASAVAVAAEVPIASGTDAACPTMTHTTAWMAAARGSALRPAADSPPFFFFFFFAAVPAERVGEAKRSGRGAANRDAAATLVIVLTALHPEKGQAPTKMRRAERREHAFGGISTARAGRARPPEAAPTAINILAVLRRGRDAVEAEAPVALPPARCPTPSSGSPDRCPASGGYPSAPSAQGADATPPPRTPTRRKETRRVGSAPPVRPPPPGPTALLLAVLLRRSELRRRRRGARRRRSGTSAIDSADALVWLALAWLALAAMLTAGELAGALRAASAAGARDAEGGGEREEMGCFSNLPRKQGLVLRLSVDGWTAASGLRLR